ncbi:hypothetical protein Taro_017996 [Colocasia esculenta]|uniref:Uncharacterized protein n=1 Tax=Colocasia esculenta TaxID=4460 RepID=A0A843USR4_COLES|nr:hypothetical protein [Colocasia esculenta]
MEGGSCLLEQGEGVPLLHSQKCEDGASDMGGRPSAKDQCGGSRAPAIILGFECLESLGFFGMSTNLVIYLSSMMHESNASIATSITTWTGTSFLSPFLGAIIADSYCGSYWMILVSSLMDLFVGFPDITLATPPPTKSASFIA